MAMPCFAARSGETPIPLHAVAAPEVEGFWLDEGRAWSAFGKAAGFRGRAGETLLVPGPGGAIAAALFGMGAGEDPFELGAAPMKLPEGLYALASAPARSEPDMLALAWALGAYAFTRYRQAERAPARLAPPRDGDLAVVERLAQATYLVRDLVNTPASDMGPRALEAAADQLMETYGADERVIVGDMLLEERYPLVHAVGRAAAEEPRLIELDWGKDPGAPLIAIVGKGVCFDSGGLNIKTGDYMRLMKKDMGGAAHALALAQLVMEAELPCRLKVVVPAVENAVGADAFRPGDIVKSRAGLTVEIENTDAEGRLVLADALTRAVEAEPALVIDFATLTGAARVALGPEVAPFYANRDDLAQELAAAAAAVRDPVWRMPLWQPYKAQIESPIADLRNSADGPMAGSIMAALFLERFAAGRPWLHFDVYAWNPSPRPGRPRGGEAQGLRAAFEFLRRRLS